MTEKDCENIYKEARRLDHLQEMGTLCKKNDWWNMIIKVYSSDHGILFDKMQPAHAHVLNLNEQLLGKFALTKEKPRNAQYIFDCWKKDGKIISIPPEYKDKIVEWSKAKSPNSLEDEPISNWAATIMEWKHLHPEI